MEKLLVTIKEDENKVKLISKIDNLLQNIELQFDEFSFDFNFKENEDCINDKFTQIFSEISTEVKEFYKKYYLLIMPKISGF